MDGVTILSEMTYRGEGPWSVVFWTCACIIVVTLMICASISDWRTSTWSGRIIEIILMLIIVVAMFIGEVAVCILYDTWYVEYKVTIDDTVGFNEFTSRYEIISNDGAIYTVRDRTVD